LVSNLNFLTEIPFSKEQTIKAKYFGLSSLNIIQSDQKENKSEQALQIIGHVVEESYANKRSMNRRRQFVVSNATL
jgi:hypothetical protein